MTFIKLYQKLYLYGLSSLLCAILLMTPIKKVNAQSLFLKSGYSGMAAMGGVGLNGDFSGPVTALSYSFNGKTDLGIVFSKLTAGRHYVTSFGLTSDILVAKQYDGDAVNVDISPGIQRSHTDVRDVYQKLFRSGWRYPEIY